MSDNPNLTREFVESQKRLYTGFFYKRFIEGAWVVAEGAIYKDSWSDDLLYDLKDEPPGLRTPGGHQQRTIAIDYGTTNPMVFLDIYDTADSSGSRANTTGTQRSRCAKRLTRSMRTT